MIDLHTIAKVLNDEFGKPFLDEGHLEARIVKEGGKEILKLRIDRRDIGVDENFKVMYAGTCMRGGCPHTARKNN